MKLDQVIAALQAHKGDGAWQIIATRSGIHYDTLARIARGAIADPSARTVEKIADAIQFIESIRSVRV